MTVKLSSLRTDIVKEREGDWIEYPDWPGVKFRVKSIQSPGFRVGRDVLIRKLTRKHKNKTIPPDEMDSELGQLYATAILLEWDGFDIPYSAEAAEEVLTAPDGGKIRSAVEWCATQVGDRDIEFVEDAAKNSEPPSATS